MAAEAQPRPPATESASSPPTVSTPLVRPAARNKIVEILANTANGCLQELGYSPVLHDRLRHLEAANAQLLQELQKARSESAERARGDAYKQQLETTSAQASDFFNKSERYKIENVKMYEDNVKLVANNQQLAEDNNALRADLMQAQTRVATYENARGKEMKDVVDQYARLQLSYGDAVRHLTHLQQQFQQFVDANRLHAVNRGAPQPPPYPQAQKPPGNQILSTAAGPSTMPVRRASAPQPQIPPQFAPHSPAYAQQPQQQPYPPQPYPPQPYPPQVVSHPQQQQQYPYPHPPPPIGFQQMQPRQIRPSSASSGPAMPPSANPNAPSPLLNGPSIIYRPRPSAMPPLASPSVPHITQMQVQTRKHSSPMSALQLPLQTFPGSPEATGPPSSASPTSSILASGQRTPMVSTSHPSPLSATGPSVQQTGFAPQLLQQVPVVAGSHGGGVNLLEGHPRPRAPPATVLPPLQPAQFAQYPPPRPPPEGQALPSAAQDSRNGASQLRQNSTPPETKMQDVDVTRGPQDQGTPPISIPSPTKPVDVQREAHTPPKVLPDLQAPRETQDPDTPPEAHEAITPPPASAVEAPVDVARSESLKRTSPDADGGDSRKRMRVDGEEEGESAAVVVKMEVDAELNATPPPPATASDDEEGEDDDEEDEIGPDGLRTVKDCVTAVFPAETGFVCAFCDARYREDLENGVESEPPQPMGDATVEEQEAHCVAEHEQVWGILRNNT